jgi:hypothetical protein
MHEKLVHRATRGAGSERSEAVPERAERGRAREEEARGNMVEFEYN